MEKLIIATALLAAGIASAQTTIQTSNSWKNSDEVVETHKANDDRVYTNTKAGVSITGGTQVMITKTEIGRAHV